MDDFLKDLNWIEIGVVYLIVHNALKAIATAIDKDPENDNLFERIIKFMGNFTKYATFGKR